MGCYRLSCFWREDDRFQAEWHLKNIFNFTRAVKKKLWSGFLSEFSLSLAISYSLLCGLQCYNTAHIYNDQSGKTITFAIISDLRAAFLKKMNLFSAKLDIIFFSCKNKWKQWRQILLSWPHTKLQALLTAAQLSCLRSPGLTEASSGSAGFLMLPDA